MRVFWLAIVLAACGSSSSSSPDMTLQGDLALPPGIDFGLGACERCQVSADCNQGDNCLFAPGSASGTPGYCLRSCNSNADCPGTRCEASLISPPSAFCACM